MIIQGNVGRQNSLVLWSPRLRSPICTGTETARERKSPSVIINVCQIELKSNFAVFGLPSEARGGGGTDMVGGVIKKLLLRGVGVVVKSVCIFIFTKS